MNFSLRKLSFGKICLDNDFNLPDRAEKMGNIDIDGQLPGVVKRANVKYGDIVVDVGAFIGDTAWSMATTAGATVFAIEPFFDAYVCAVFNCQGLPVTCINKPAGNGEFVKMVYDAPSNERGPNLGMRSVRTAHQSDDGAVPTLRIDDLDLPSCRFMKIDCEGSEIPTLLGAAETIKKFRPILFVEMFKGGLGWRGYTPEQLEQTIRDLGYTLEMIGDHPRWDWYCVPI